MCKKKEDSCADHSWRYVNITSEDPYLTKRCDIVEQILQRLWAPRSWACELSQILKGNVLKLLLSIGSGQIPTCHRKECMSKEVVQENVLHQQSAL